MGMRFRDVANKVIYQRLTSPGKNLPPEVILDREALGRKFHPKGRKMTEKQLAKLQKYYNKFVERLKKKIDKADARAAAKARAKAANPKKKGKNPFLPKKGKGKENPKKAEKVADTAKSKEKK